MQVTFRASFGRDLKKIKDQRLPDRIREAIEGIEQATVLDDVCDLKKLSGFTEFYRLRVGDYRIGIVLDGGRLEFVRCLPRREIYRLFP